MSPIERLKHFLLCLIEIIKNVLICLIPDTFRREKNIKNEIVLITGAASGIGRSLASKFAQLGCRVVLVDVNQTGLKETKQLLDEKFPGNMARSYETDVSDRDAVYRLAEKVRLEVGPVNLLVNNAAIMDMDLFLDMTDARVRREIDVNLMGYIWTTKAFLTGMVEQGRGHLVYVSSLVAFNGGPFISCYSACKAGVSSFSEAIGQEILFRKWKGIRVSTVYPVIVRSSIFDMSEYDGIIPVLEPDYAAEEIVRGILVGREKIYLPRSSYYFCLVKHFLNAKAAWHLSVATALAEDAEEQIKQLKSKLILDKTLDARKFMNLLKTKPENYPR